MQITFIFNKQGKKMDFKLSLFTLLIIGVFLTGCSDDTDEENESTSDLSRVEVSSLGSVTVSGSTIGAVARTPISELSVTMRVNGGDYTVSTEESTGAFAFTKVPADSEYVISITDPTNVFAPYFYSNITPNLRDNANSSADEILTQDIGSAELYNAETTSISIQNFNGGTGIAGLSLYYDANQLAEENGASVSIQIPDVVAAADTSTVGLYTFNLPATQDLVEVKVNTLTDSSNVEYEPFQGEVTDSVLTTIKAGESISYYLKPIDATIFTIIYHLVDDEGHALDAGPVLAIWDSTYSRYMSLQKVTDSTNEYALEVTADDMSNMRYVLGIDVDGDGFNDWSANYFENKSLGLTNSIGRQSFNEDKELTIVYPMIPTDYSEDVQAEIISSDDNFQAGGLGEIIIAFDRPITILHGIRMTRSALTESSDKKSVQNPADIYEANYTTTATTIQGESNINLNSSKEYEYIDEDGDTVTLSIADNDGNVVSPYGNTFKQTKTVTELTDLQYTLGADSSLLTIDLSSLPLISDITYNFEFSLIGQLDNNPVAFMSFSKTAKSSATASLETLTIDNFDYKETTTKDLLDSAAEEDLSNQTEHTDKFSQLNVTYPGAGSGQLAQAKYLTVHSSISEGNEIEDLTTLSHAQNSIYLISKAQLTGTLRIVSKTETYLLDSESTTETYSSSGDFYKLDMPSQDIVAGDTDLTELTDILSEKIYLLDRPSNHIVNGSGINDVYGVGISSGAEIEAEGIYYCYELPLGDPIYDSSNGYWSSVELDLDLTVNGLSLIGSQTFDIK